jgi:glycosyltransferase involved in cell wall biosynthesis
MPRVSVIICAYNSAHYIGRAIASARAQTEPDIEIIIVDDASTDGLHALVTPLLRDDPRVRLIQRCANGGPAAARNSGLAAARGEWIAPLDSDDAFAPDRLATLIALAETTHSDMCADNLMIEGTDDDDWVPMIPPELARADRHLGLAEFIERNRRNPETQLLNFGFLKPIFRRRFLERHGLAYDAALRFGEDFRLYIECLRAGARWWMTQRAHYHYVLREGSARTMQSSADLDRLRRFERELLAEARSRGDGRLVAAATRHLRRRDRNYYYRAFTDAVKAGEYRSALGYALESPRSFTLIAAECLNQAPTLTRKALGLNPA